MVTLLALLPYRPGQKVLDNNNTKPSMKKETHCFYRYRIWHRKHGSALGLGGLWAELLDPGPPAHGLVANLLSPGSQTSEAGRLISVSSFFPVTTPSHLVAQFWRKFTVRKSLASRAATRKEIGSPSKPQKSALRKPRLAITGPRYARGRRAGRAEWSSECLSLVYLAEWRAGSRLCFK